jgi:hypothetical protein
MTMLGGTGLTGPVLLLDTLTGRLFAPSGAIRFGDVPSLTSLSAPYGYGGAGMNMNMMMSQYNSGIAASMNAINNMGGMTNMYNNMYNMNTKNESSNYGSLIGFDNGELGDVDAADIIQINESDVLIASPSSSSIDDSVVTSPIPFSPPSSDDSISSSSSSSSSPVHGSSSPAPSVSSTSSNGSTDQVAASLLSSLSSPSSPVALQSLPSAVPGALVVPTSPLSMNPISSCQIGSSMYGAMLMPLLTDHTDVDASPFNWPVDAQPFTIGTSLVNKVTLVFHIQLLPCCISGTLLMFDPS